MSIFISNRAKKNTQGYWFGLFVPILVGVGCSFLSMMLVNTDVPVSEFDYIDYVFLTFVMAGHLVVWPLMAWLLTRSNPSERFSRRKGAYMSLKLYVFWIAFILFNSILGALGGE